MNKCINIRGITSPDDKALETLIPLYDRCFPERVKEDPAIFRKMLGSDSLGSIKGTKNRFHILGAFEGEAPVGFISFNYIASTNIGFVGYIVVNEVNRGARIGERLIHAMADKVEEDANLSGSAHSNGVLFEVERVEDANDEHEKLINEKRISFFERFGSKILPVEYWQPPLEQGSEGVRLHLMYYSADRGSENKQVSLYEIVAAVYEDIYGSDNIELIRKVTFYKEKALATIKTNCF